MLADQLYSEAVCVSLWLSPPDNSMDSSSSDTAHELIITLRMADPSRRSEEKLLPATSFSRAALPQARASMFAARSEQTALVSDASALAKASFGSARDTWEHLNLTKVPSPAWVFAVGFATNGNHSERRSSSCVRRTLGFKSVPPVNTTVAYVPLIGSSSHSTVL